MTPVSKRALFVTFEGTEGAGKSTQVAVVEKHYSGRGLRVLKTREPGGTALGNGIRDLLLRSSGDPPTALAEVFLLEAARTQHVDRVLRDALTRYDLILCDRFADSTTAYQGGGRSLDLTWLAEINRIATGGLVPDLTVLLDVSPETSVPRAVRRLDQSGSSASEGRFEGEPSEFHRRVRQAYLDLSKADPGRFLVVDASLPAPDITNAVIERLDPLLDRKA